MIVDRTGYDEAMEALSLDVISTRDCVSATLEDGAVKRFVVDTVSLDFDGNQYVEVPAAKIETVSRSTGNLADSLSIRLDGAAFTVIDSTSDALLIELMQTRLRDRPIQVSTMVLNDMTARPIGLIPIFAGFIDNTMIDRSEREEGTLWTLTAASYRAYARRRPQRLLTHNDHIQRWPQDNALRNLADTIFTNGVARWNKTTTGSSGALNVFRAADLIHRVF